ncbi:hypothetical protein ACVWXO_000596 [Bradyrhizobium sp. LM2.7]
MTRDITPADWPATGVLDEPFAEVRASAEFSYQKPLFGVSASAASEGDGPKVNYAGPTEEARRICRV